MHRGRHDEYHALSSADGSLHSVIEAVPELVLGRVLAITSFDSGRGPLELTDQEGAAGWVSRDGIVISPPVADVSSPPGGPFDEWCVFGDAVPSASALEVSVNDGRFSPTPPSLTAPIQDPTWGKVALREGEELVSDMQAPFRSQLGLLGALAYLAEGAVLTTVTRSKTEHDKVWAILDGARL